MNAKKLVCKQAGKSNNNEFQNEHLVESDTEQSKEFRITSTTACPLHHHPHHSLLQCP